MVHKWFSLSNWEKYFYEIESLHLDRTRTVRIRQAAHTCDASRPAAHRYKPTQVSKYKQTHKEWMQEIYKIDICECSRFEAILHLWSFSGQPCPPKSNCMCNSKPVMKVVATELSLLLLQKLPHSQQLSCCYRLCWSLGQPFWVVNCWKENALRRVIRWLDWLFGGRQNCYNVCPKLGSYPVDALQSFTSRREAGAWT